MYRAALLELFGYSDLLIKLVVAAIYQLVLIRVSYMVSALLTAYK